jgi:uncharacterized protein (AIM24 family)
MAKYEIIETDLMGSDNLLSAEKLFYLKQSGMKLKQIKITLENEEIITEAGALHFMKGNISPTNKIPSVGNFIQSKLSGEAVFRPRYQGTGEIYLEPTFGHFIVHEINEDIIVDKGIFYSCESSITVGAVLQNNISSAILGGEGLFQTRLSGKGKVVLISPTPVLELKKYKLNNDKLSVDGNFAILRSASIDFRVEKSSKTLIGTAFSGEGLLQTFQGVGEVWIAPLKSVYDKLASPYSGVQTTEQKSMNKGIIETIIKGFMSGR